ncbi:MAG: RluA family pseudouridine synthase, partial [Thermoguttaceae bacterium]|nr:RluA family pseudouridine synthase [Thermoguttaceae bacterium]
AKRTIYEDNHLLVLNKPAGLATMGVSPSEDSLFTLAQRYIKIKYQKPGDVYLGVVSRLDLPVSGLVVFARTSKAAGRLNEQFRNHTVQKIYHALVEGNLQPDEAELNDVICEDKARRRLWIPDRFDSNVDVCSPKEARLRYRVLEKFPKTTLVEATLLTGRKHQIRLQLSHQGTPIVGDGKYGAKPITQAGICLHAFQLSLIHPTTREQKSFISSPPDWSFAK